MRSHIVWNVAAAALLLHWLPVLVAADQPDMRSERTQDIVIKLDANDSPDTCPDPDMLSSRSLMHDVCDLAISFLGTPYRWGGTTPRAFDCSGFVRYVYGKLGIKLPRTARQQIKVGRKVSGALLRAGDLIFFDMMKGYVSHVGMYLGNGLFIHASTPRTGVRIDSLFEPKYGRRLVGARRYIS